MSFSTKECAWAQTKVKVLGRTLIGIKGFEFNYEIEKELLYAAGSKAIDILEGNEKVDGSLTLLKYEVDMMNDAAVKAGYQNILKVPYTLIVITCSFQLTANSALKCITVPGAAFTKLPISQNQNDKGTSVQMPFMATEMLLL